MPGYCDRLGAQPSRRSARLRNALDCLSIIPFFSKTARKERHKNAAHIKGHPLCERHILTERKNITDANNNIHQTLYTKCLPDCRSSYTSQYFRPDLFACLQGFHPLSYSRFHYHNCESSHSPQSRLHSRTAQLPLRDFPSLPYRGTSFCFNIPTSDGKQTAAIYGYG